MSLKPATEYTDLVKHSQAQYRAAERQANAEREKEKNAFDGVGDITLLEWDRALEMVNCANIDMICYYYHT
jgi:hypothetical protein